MLRVVFDTNVVISGLLWSGAAQRALNSARDKKVLAFATEEMLDELREVLTYTRIVKRLQALNQSAEDIVSLYLSYVQIVETQNTGIVTIALRDEDDRMILACAVSQKADAVVSGDDDLVSVGSVETIAIWTIGQFLERIASSDDTINP